MILPNFLIIGAQKAGTTALYSFLNSQKDIHMSPIKEPHFFTYMGESTHQRGWGKQRNPIIRDMEAYANLFANGHGFKAIGEASPSYIYSPVAPKRINKIIPDVKLIAILRNPVDRAFSNYIHCRRTNREPIDNFRDAIIAEDKRVAEGWGFLWHYKRKGFYSKQLKRYFSIFDRDQILILEYQDFSDDQKGSIHNILNFLEIPSGYDHEGIRTYNVSGLPKNRVSRMIYSFFNTQSGFVKKLLPNNLRKIGLNLILDKPELSTDDRNWLKSEYQEDISKLERLVDIELNHWK